MEDRHTILANYEPAGAAAAAADAGVLRSFAGVYDGHNGSQSAEEAAARYALLAQSRAKPLYMPRLQVGVTAVIIDRTGGSVERCSIPTKVLPLGL